MNICNFMLYNQSKSAIKALFYEFFLRQILRLNKIYSILILFNNISKYI